MAQMHDHSLTALDRWAQRSHLSGVSAAIKITVAVLSLICAVAGTPFVSMFVLVVLSAATVYLGKVPLHTYLHFLLLPVGFIAVSGIVLLFDISAAKTGFVSLPFLGRFLCITPHTFSLTWHVSLRALAAVSCLYSLSLSTPVYEIIEALRRAHMPEIIIELMFLMYRYIFILAQTLSHLQTAARARLGFITLRTSLRSTGGIMLNLLVLSFRRAGASFDAMEARCYTGHLRFPTPQKPLRMTHVLICTAYFVCLAAVWVLQYEVL